MVEKCGDDLIAARRFTNLCTGHMREIFSGGSLPLTDVITRLADIQSQAKIMQARAVYKSAQTVIDDLTKKCSVEACAGSVLVLQRLIRQYETGLNEVMPQVTATTVKPKTQTHPRPISPINDRVEQSQAAAILKPLIKFADPNEQVHLVSLLSLAANDQVSKPKVRSNKIDSIMPSLTNNLLRRARTDGKSVSISYASDNSALDETILNQLQAQLESAGNTLIQTCVGTPSSRQEKGQSQSAHLAITSKADGDKLGVLISCDGVAAHALEGDMVLPSLAELGVQSMISVKDGLTRFEIFQIPYSIDTGIRRPKREASL